MYTNLIKAVTEENRTRLNNVMEIINEKYEQYLTDTRKTQLKHGTLTLEKAIEIATKKVNKEADKKLQIEIDKINRIESAPDFIECTLSIDWIKSRTWGSNPQCELEGRTKNRYYHFTSSRVGGCGYDKESTATSEALNKFDSILKLMYQLKNDNIDTPNHALFGYGSGYGILPYFEGGVGVSAMNDICRSIGCEFKHVSNGKTFDVFMIKRGVNV